MTNAAMMGIQPSEFRELSWHEYTGLLTVWNERHSPEGDADAPDAPDADFVAAQFAKLAERGLVGSVH